MFFMRFYFTIFYLGSFCLEGLLGEYSISEIRIVNI